MQHYIKIYIGFIGLIAIMLSAGMVQAQDDFDEEDLFEIDYDSPLTIDLESEEDIEIPQIKKKKVKKNVFYGKKTKKGFTRTGFGQNVVIEFFHYLKEYEDPDQYVRDIYWYNFRKRKIIKSRKIDKPNAAILHGPYKKLLGDKVLEEGIFYKGTKHGRWSRWNKYDILQSKEKYYKGWPKESKVAYYNRYKKQINEIIPMHFGEKEGNYYAFYESGNIAVIGEYHFDAKVGTWREYYDRRNRRKREIRYSKDPFDSEFRPFIIREWDERGRLIYDKSKKNNSSR